MPCTPTAAQLASSGKVSYTFTEASASAGGFAAHTAGSFITAGGYSAHFSTISVGVFVGSAGGSLALGKGSSQSLAIFSNGNCNITGSLAIYSFSDNFDPDSLNHIGKTDALSTPGLGLGGTYSNTKLSDVMCPR